jgi:actin
MKEATQTVIIDIGAGSTKAGLSGNKYPLIVFPTMLGRPKRQGILEKELYIGDYVILKRGLLNVSQTIERGNILNWHDIEKLLFAVFMRNLESTLRITQFS